ncbi:lipocalin family protein [Arenibacter sp. F20364]|uniref:lipocalin family protein n=1 Tax=Arenibacter sp. F20364 TaxID=2926415 RepID=UPI001FF4959A|nr:lipocalin family protein [Arenibacter sp. F20364]
MNKLDLSYLNGYWEIEKVTFPDGSEKEYTVNTSIDYIEVKDQKGFRKKVQPNFNGNYHTSNDAEMFSIYENNGVFTLDYKTDLSEWHEKIISLSENSFTVLSEENIKYRYRKFEPINLEQ